MTTLRPTPFLSTRNSIKIVYLLYFLTVLFNVSYILGALHTLLTERWIEGLSSDFGAMDVMNVLYRKKQKP
uniref:Uncharacterized protein n=1 Tax=Acrobeloides nanus TaxID=290746 RepID=A0A914CVK6_9BILA